MGYLYAHHVLYITIGSMKRVPPTKLCFWIDQIHQYKILNIEKDLFGTHVLIYIQGVDAEIALKYILHAIFFFV